MFARKPKSSDVMQSVSRFADVHRDSVSRVKHLKILLDSLTVHEKRQLIDDYSFETFHLVDELLLQTDIAGNPQAAIEAESGLWTLEQVLCLAPELVGNGWQRHAIESLLKKAIYPGNLLAVRKIAIRLFLLFYQSLSVFGKATPDLDRVFQSLLPYFPLRNGESTELILQEYCQSAGTVQWDGQTSRNPSSPTGNQPGVQTQPTAKERAQMLQVYLDKFLEYCTRESTRIEWNDEGKRLECAKFILDKLITLYIHETFPDLDSNGVDIFGGWEGADESAEPLDTADPVVIARYWLIRWLNNVAGARQQYAGSVHPGLILFHQALFSSPRAINTLLTLQREAMQLPLPCSNVIHKVVTVMSSWLVQQEVPPFVASGAVSLESSSFLLLHILLSFFHSPYLKSPGDRAQSATSIAFSILRACRELACRLQLPKPLTAKVWSELVARLCDAASTVCANSDRFSQETASAFASTILSSIVMIRAVRKVDLDDKLWDDVNAVFEKGIWMPMAIQWSKISRAVTRALVLHIAHVDLISKEEMEKNVATLSVSSRRGTRSDVLSTSGRETTSVDESGSMATDDSQDDNVFTETDDISQAVQRWDGDPIVWLVVWKRFICMIGPNSKAKEVVAVETISSTIQSLLSVGLDSLTHWLSIRLVFSPQHALSQCVQPLTAVLTSKNPPPLLQAHILCSLTRLLSCADSSVLSHLSIMSPRHLAVLAPHLLQALPRLTMAPSSDLLKVLALLSPQHPSAEQLLLHNVHGGDLTLQMCLLCVNALSLLIVQRADVELMHKVCGMLLQHRFGPRLLPVFCSSILPLTKFGMGSAIMETLIAAAGVLRDERLRTEIEWMLVSMCLTGPRKEMAQVLRGILADKQNVLEGNLLCLAGQWPLPGFTASKWNSIESSLPTQNAINPHEIAFIDRRQAVISVNKSAACEITSRTPVGKHVWTVEPHTIERKGGRNVCNWLKKEANKGRRAGRESVGILGAMEDPFDILPPSTHSKRMAVLDTDQWRKLVDASRRVPQVTHSISNASVRVPSARLLEWRSFAASMGFVPGASQVPVNFHRDLRHLDQTCSREVHKVAVIYVPEGLTDKQSILSNTSSSDAFFRFCAELGWEVKIGRGHEGYSGGLPVDTLANYHATPDTEVIFHVSTKLGGDVTHKVRHLGNDEVHIVWNENSRPYRRETIATKFCDVLIVIEKAESTQKEESEANVVYRVRMETQSALEFGPLFDGALVGQAELALLVRVTAVNASRAYRLARDEHARPLRHRESVFGVDTKRHVKPSHLADAINSLYVPTMVV